MWSLEFWKATGERAIKTFAQSLSALLVGEGIGLLQIAWWHVLSVAALAGITSVVTSVASGVITNGEISLARAETLTRVSRSYAPRRMSIDEEGATRERGSV